MERGFVMCDGHLMFYPELVDGGIAYTLGLAHN